MTAAQFNERVGAAARVQRLSTRRRTGGGASFQHWQVSSAREGERLWRIAVGGGVVNGRPAVITENGVRRSIFADPAPTILVTAPDAAGKNSVFRKVADAQRPASFKGSLVVGTQTQRGLNAFGGLSADRGALDLYRCTIAVSGSPPLPTEILLDFPPLLPLPVSIIGVLSDVAIRATLASLGVIDVISVSALLSPFVVAAHPPVQLANDGTELMPLADLWLTRDPGIGPASDALYVQQRAFWSFAAFKIVPDDGLLSILPILQSLSDIGNLSAIAIFETLLNIAAVRWWTV